MVVRAKPRAVTRQEVLVHCYSCRDVFTVVAVLSGRDILRYEPTSHIIAKQHVGTRCRCGGYLSFVRISPQ